MNGFVHDIGIGVAMGIPMLVVVGPIALLLVDVGSQRGLRSGTPAALGVALGDVLLAVVVAVGGTALASVLTPVAGWFRVIAALMVAGLALHVVHAVRRTGEVKREAVPALDSVAVLDPPVVFDRAPALGSALVFADVLVGPCVTTAGPPASAPSGLVASVDADEVAVAAAAVAGSGADAAGGRGAGRLLGGFTALTLANPLTLLVYVGLVVGGGAGVGTAGWVVGMGVASLVVHSSWVGVGHVMGTAVPPAALRALRYVAAGLLLGLAVHLLLG